MSERIQSTSHDADERLGANYFSSANVEARFLTYEMGQPYVNIEDKAIAALNLQGKESIVDLGSGNGNFLRKMRVEYGHKGRITGVEPNMTQYTGEPIWQSLEPGVIVSAMQHYYGTKTKLSESEMNRYIANGLPRSDSNEIEMLKGRADAIPIHDNSVDVLCAFFMMYHIKSEEQPIAFKEIKRVLTPDGSFLMTTSGDMNKAVHRTQENDIAAFIGIKPPQPMNIGFTTQKAMVVLPAYFRHVKAYVYKADMIVKDRRGVEAYISSIRSVYDQFEPIPAQTEFDKAIETIVRPRIKHAFDKHGCFTDIIERSIFLCRDKPFSAANEDFLDVAPAQKSA